MSNGLLPGAEAALALRSRWTAEFKAKANEEPVVAKDIPKLNNMGQGGIGDTIYVRIVPVVTAEAAIGTTEMGPESLTWHQGTTTRVSQTPTGRYNAVEIPITTESKMEPGEFESFQRTYRDQMLASLKEAMDASAATLGLSLGTALGPGNFDKSLLTSALGTLRTSAKEHVKNGSMLHLKYHPSQHDNLITIAEVANAELRGDSENPNVKGSVLKGWGMTFEETGTIQQSGSNYYNMLFAEPAFGKAFNLEPQIVGAEQRAGLVVRMVGFGEWAFVEVFDEDALAIRSAA